MPSFTCAYTFSEPTSVPNIVYQKRTQYSDATGNSGDVMRAFLAEWPVFVELL